MFTIKFIQLNQPVRNGVGVAPSFYDSIICYFYRHAFVEF